MLHWPHRASASSLIYSSAGFQLKSTHGSIHCATPCATSTRPHPSHVKTFSLSFGIRNLLSMYLPKLKLLQFSGHRSAFCNLSNCGNMRRPIPTHLSGSNQLERNHNQTKIGFSCILNPIINAYTSTSCLLLLVSPVHVCNISLSHCLVTDCLIASVARGVGCH